MIAYLVAEASTTAQTMEVPAVAALVVAIITALGGGFVGRASVHKAEVGPQPFEIVMKEKFATKEEISVLNTKLEEMSKLLRDSETKLHTRINTQSELIAKVSAQMDMIINHTGCKK